MQCKLINQYPMVKNVRRLINVDILQFIKSFVETLNNIASLFIFRQKL